MLSTSVVLILLAAVMGSGAMVAVLGWMAIRLRSLEAGKGGADLERLLAQVEALREELEASSHEIDELTERLDFTESLLRGGEDRPALGKGDKEGS